MREKSKEGWVRPWGEGLIKVGPLTLFSTATDQELLDCKRVPFLQLPPSPLQRLPRGFFCTAQRRHLVGIWGTTDACAHHR